MDHGFKLHPDGTLKITLPRGKKVGRVLVCEAGTQNGSLYYPENNVSDINVGDMINCTDCIKHGGDWECDRMQCHKGTKQQATKASDCISRRAVSSWLEQYGQDVLHGKYKFSLMYIWKNLMDLPSAEPEIIRCKNCEYGEQDHEGDWFCRSYGFQIGGPDGSGFCSEAERRTDE